MFTTDMLPNCGESNKGGLFKFWTLSNKTNHMKDSEQKVSAIQDDISVTERSDEDLTSSRDYDDEELEIKVTLLADDHESNCFTASSFSTGSLSALTEESFEQQQQQQASVVVANKQQQRPISPLRDNRRKKERSRKFIKQNFTPAPMESTPATQASTPCPLHNLSSEDRQALWLIWATMQIHAGEVQRLDERAAIGKRMLRKLYTWSPQRVRDCLQCPPEGRGGILADMARHILAYKMGHLCTDILQKVSACVFQELEQLLA